MHEYDALPQPAREQVLAEMLHRAGLQPHDLLNDDDLVAAADRLFQELDRREKDVIAAGIGLIANRAIRVRLGAIEWVS